MIPLLYEQNFFVIPPHHHLIIKAAKLVSVIEAEIDHPLGLLKKVRAGNLRGILIVLIIFLTLGQIWKSLLPFLPHLLLFLYSQI